ncbi:efflux RND transporter permease subunit [Ectothiorhodospiraceae bacterium 2226]|nr:efflux RND transporter permease subunit [Ectothiorhodospiraceae bacterium 2226]
MSLDLQRRLRGGGLAEWSIRHPIGVVMLALAAVVLGGFALTRLGVDLLPEIIYPEIVARVAEQGVPATVMEDRITRYLEEQLAITEDAISVQSNTSEGSTQVNLSFPYGKDIDIALRDASTRLDRARRQFPTTIDQPTIFKRDPSQIPVAEYVVSSPLMGPVALRQWVDEELARWFLNLPGVAAAEVGGGLTREIWVMPDQDRLAAYGLTVQDVVQAVERGNVDAPGGRIAVGGREMTGRTAGRVQTVEDLAALPLAYRDAEGQPGLLRLGEVAQVVDTHEDERVRVRLNEVPGVRMSIQKQPQANTVSVVDHVEERLAWLASQGLIPEEVEVRRISDQSGYVRDAIRNASLAAGTGAVLAMLVVYIFLGNLRRTLIIGSAIPIAVMVTFFFMDVAGLTLNIMTLGGLALGIGMLVDSTIVMLENITRHQRAGESLGEAAVNAAREVNSAIVAATSTNLAAVLPFLFIGGLVGLLFRELIITISAAIVAALVVALTLVPALGSRVVSTHRGMLRRGVDAGMSYLQSGYAWTVRQTLRLPWLVVALFVAALLYTGGTFFSGNQVFLPSMDDGQVRLNVNGDMGIELEEMDAAVRQLERLLLEQPEVVTVSTTAGGFIFGRSQREASHRSTLMIQLVPLAQRHLSSEEWIRSMDQKVRDLGLVGMRVHMRTQGIRGIRLGRGDDQISLRIAGPDLETLAQLGEALVGRLGDIEGLRNLSHSYEEVLQEVSVRVDRERANALGVAVEDVGRTVRVALEGLHAGDFLAGNRGYDIRVRLPREQFRGLEDLRGLIVQAEATRNRPVYLAEVAELEFVPAPTTIRRDNQQRVVEISGSVSDDVPLGQVDAAIQERLADFELPRGYTLYDEGATKALQEGAQTSQILLALALFLVFVVMAVQYESLRNPLIILFSVPFAAIGVALGLTWQEIPLSMPVWLGMIMLAGIVVNNAIVLVEYIEIQRERGLAVLEATVEAARLRLRPILMTTLTTVAGMLPLALALGEGGEMLRPLAQVIVFGLSFSMLVSLFLVPSVYRLGHPRG